MRQVVQEVGTGKTLVREFPDPMAPPGGVLVANVVSMVSAGTERYVVELAKKSLIGKARERPDHVRRVLQKMRQEGVLQTIQQVRAKLDEPMALGYSAAGVVLECGRGVSDLAPGDRVAVAGPHAEIVAVGRNLVARIPENVSFEQAAYGAIGAIALEGVRLARAQLSERVVVIGLGLIGQITVALLKAQGCRVFGIDLDPKKLELAKVFGADAVATGNPREAIAAFTNQHGADAVIITAATDSNEPIELAAEVARVRGRIVLVGVAGLNIPRPPFFMKELEFTVSGSLGPGRGDPQYEERGIDLPFGHVRWTAGRNLEAVLDVISQGRLPVEKLTTHHFPIERAEGAYELITAKKEPFLGVAVTYPPPPERRKRRIELSVATRPDGVGISVIGAGNFARLVLLPALGKVGGTKLRGLVSAKGMNAEYSGRGLGFAYAASDVDEVLRDPQTHAVFVLTRHDLHADLVVRALEAGKHVFVEKPLCIKFDELSRIAATIDRLGDKCPMLMVGFNRRFAAPTARIGEHFAGAGPLSVHYRFAPGELPKEAWPHDEDVGGGRLVGEACHAIDLVTAIAGSPPVRVHAESIGPEGVPTTDDRTAIVIKHANGAVSTVSYQAGGDRGGPTERVEVFGGGRSATLEGWDALELWRGGSAEKKSYGKDKGHAAEIEAFVRACRGGHWPIPWADLYGVTWASLAAIQSLREGRPVDEAEASHADG